LKLHAPQAGVHTGAQVFGVDGVHVLHHLTAWNHTRLRYEMEQHTVVMRDITNLFHAFSSGLPDKIEGGVMANH
jgi:hypothetical protein